MNFSLFKKPVVLLGILVFFLFFFSIALYVIFFKTSKPIPISERSIVIVTDSALLAKAVTNIGFQRCDVYILPDEITNKLTRKQKGIRKKYIKNADLIMSFSSQKKLFQNSYLSTLGDDKRLICFADKIFPNVNNLSKKHDYFYLSIPLWEKCLFLIYEQLKNLDPANETYYRNNLTLHKVKLTEIQTLFNHQFSRIPVKKRKLYAFDESFFYLCKDQNFSLHPLLKKQDHKTNIQNIESSLHQKPPYDAPLVYNFHLKDNNQEALLKYLKKKSPNQSFIIGIYTQLNDETYEQNSYFSMMLYNYKLLLSCF